MNIKEKMYMTLRGGWFALMSAVFTIPAFVSAQSGGSPVVGPTTLTNPLKFNTITEFFMAILEIITVFAVPIIVFFIIFAGFKYVTANGNAEKVKSAHSALTWALVGGVIVLGAQVLLVVIQNTVNALK